MKSPPQFMLQNAHEWRKLVMKKERENSENHVTFNALAAMLGEKFLTDSNTPRVRQKTLLY